MRRLGRIPGLDFGAWASMRARPHLATKSLHVAENPETVIERVSMNWSYLDPTAEDVVFSDSTYIITLIDCICLDSEEIGGVE